MSPSTTSTRELEPKTTRLARLGRVAALIGLASAVILSGGEELANARSSQATISEERKSGAEQAATNRTGDSGDRAVGDLSSSAVRQIEALLAQKARRTPAQRKVSSRLLDAAGRPPGRAATQARRDTTATDAPKELVTVDIRAEVTPVVLARIRSLGGMVVNSLPRYGVVRARLPLDAVEPLALLEAVRFIRPAEEPVTRQVPKHSAPDFEVFATSKVDTTEGDVAHQANVARQTHSVDGTGIGVGVISDGVDGFANQQATGDVPAQVTVLPGQEGGVVDLSCGRKSRGNEGAAIFEIIHDLAPGAELFFATGGSGRAQMAQNIEDLCAAGADVIVDDVGYLLSPVFQDGVISRAVSAVTARGCYYFSAAGNNGNLNDGTSGVWEGDYAEGSDFEVNGVSVGKAHEFESGVTGNRIEKDAIYPITLQWTDPIGGSSNDYDLFVIDADNDVISSSTDTQDGTQDPLEYISSDSACSADREGNRIVIVKNTGAADRYLRLNTGGRLAIATSGQIFGHPASQDAVGVAAVDVADAGGAGGVFDGTETIESFSSDGPRRMFFEADGTPITPGNFSSTGGRVLQKPDLTAADGVSTSTPGFSDFHGTSAAAPHAAGIAALMVAAAGGPAHLTSSGLRTAMTGSALDIEATGVDRDSGDGIVMAPGAVDAVDVALADRNLAPTVVSELVDRTLESGADPVTIDLKNVFNDPNNDTLDYSLQLSRDVLSVTLSGSVLTLTATDPIPKVVATVRAADPGGLSTPQTFSFTVTAPPPPPPPPPPPTGGGGGGLLFPPHAPQNLTALPGDVAVRLVWSPPENDGGDEIRRYEYRLKEGRSQFGEWTPIPDSAPDEVHATGYTVGDLLNGTVYAFELRAVNAAGNGRVSEGVEVTMPLDPAYWSNFRAEDLVGVELMLEVFFSDGSGDREVRFGAGLRFEEDQLDGQGEVTATRMGSYGYRYTGRTTGELSLDFDGGEACQVRLTFAREGEGSYVYRCGGSLVGQGSFELSELTNRVPEITSTGPFDVEENTTRVGQLEAVDWDEEDEVTGYGIAGGADRALFQVEAEMGELSFREAPDYENPGDVESEEPASPAGDNEYILVVEVRSGEGDRERSRQQAIRVRVSDVEMEEAIEEEMGEDETESLFVPVILSSAGRDQSFFTSELTLTNRGDDQVKLNYTYTATDEPEKRNGTASDLLPAGRQKIATDALEYLRGLGMPIPKTGNQLGTLRVEVPLSSKVEALVRTTTVVPDGRAGLAYLGVAEEEGFTEAAYLCGLRQNQQDRSNVAVQNMGTEGAITVRTIVFSGEETDSSPRDLGEMTLQPGGFHQYNQVLNVLGSNASGYVKVERVEGEAPFYAYGVINDQANSDGSFVFPVTASSLEGKTGQTLPVIVETRDFTSELTVTNFSEEPRTLNFQFVSEQIKGEEKVVGFRMDLDAGEQVIVPELVEELRREEMAKLGRGRGFYLGPLFVTAEEADLSGIVVGARTGSRGGDGTYSVFYNAVPEGGGFNREAWVYGLQQNEENRSNLALVNTGEVDGSASVFHVEIYDGESGMLAETVVTKPISARGWHQIDGILLRASADTRQGYIRIERMSGENPFLAYGVVNDGGTPGERSGDGAYLPARE